MEALKTKEFWNDVLGRAIYTFAETFLGILLGAKIFAEVDWVFALSSCGFATLIAFVKSFIVALDKYKPEQ